MDKAAACDAGVPCKHCFESGLLHFRSLLMCLGKAAGPVAWDPATYEGDPEEDVGIGLTQPLWPFGE